MGTRDDQRAAERLKAVFGNVHSPKPAKPKQKAPEVQPLPPWKGLMQMLDPGANRAWEATLKSAELDTWNALKDLLVKSSPEMRWRAVAYVFRAVLEFARRMYATALNVTDERYKAELVKRAGIRLRGAMERLEVRLSDVYPTLVHLPPLLNGLWEDMRMVEDAQHILRNKVVHPAAWAEAWPGAARGAGISGYDTPGGVQRHQEAVRQAHEEYTRKEREKAQAKRAKRQPKPKRRKRGEPEHRQTNLTE